MICFPSQLTAFYMTATVAFNGLRLLGDKIIVFQNLYPVGNYMLKVSNRNTRTRCEICSKVTIKTPERVNFEQVNAGWVFRTRGWIDSV